VGEAKRRREAGEGPRPKRLGLVLSNPMRIVGHRMEVAGFNLHPREVRFGLLFWDELVWPRFGSIYMANNADAEFLECAGILRRPMYNPQGPAEDGVARSHIQAFLDLEAKEPGVWSLSGGEAGLKLAGPMLGRTTSDFVELHRAIPVPDKDVAFADILEFRSRRRDELTDLRSKIDELAVRLGKDISPEDRLAPYIAIIDQACANVLRVSKEWRFPVTVADMEVSPDIRPTTVVTSGVAGYYAGLNFGLPNSTAVLAGTAAAAGSMVKIGNGWPRLQRIKPRPGPYRYVARYHDEVF
jgi:hypothetical protein